MSIDRDAVLMAAARVLARNPGASMADVASGADISRASLNRLVPGRDALLVELGELGRRRAAAALLEVRLDEDDPVVALRRVITALVPMADLFNLLYREQPVSQSYEQTAEVDAALARLFQRGQRAGVFRLDMSTTWMTEALYLLVLGAAEAAQSGRLAVREVATMAELTLLGGIATPSTGGES